MFISKPGFVFIFNVLLATNGFNTKVENFPLISQLKLDNSSFFKLLNSVHLQEIAMLQEKEPK